MLRNGEGGRGKILINAQIYDFNLNILSSTLCIKEGLPLRYNKVVVKRTIERKVEEVERG